jgi:hypothetical protein
MCCEMKWIDFFFDLLVAVVGNFVSCLRVKLELKV